MGLILSPESFFCLRLLSTLARESGKSLGISLDTTFDGSRTHIDFVGRGFNEMDFSRLDQTINLWTADAEKICGALRRDHLDGATLAPYQLALRVRLKEKAALRFDKDIYPACDSHLLLGYT